MRTLLLLILLSLNINLFAQEEYVNYADGTTTYHEFEEGQESYLLADNVNVRSSTSTTSTVVANLPIGTKVKIIEKSRAKLRLNGFKTNWYKISFKSSNNVSTGYVWGGLIAEGTIVSAKDTDILFMYGVASLKANAEGKFPEKLLKIQLRACKENKELSRISIDSDGSLNIYHWLGNRGNRGLNKVEDIIEFGESEQACAGMNAYHIVFWDGKDLLPVTTLYPGGDAPYYASDDLIFPSDPKGVKGKIIRDQQEGWYDDETEKDIVERHKQVAYIWTGEVLKKTKVLIDEEKK